MLIEAVSTALSVVQLFVFDFPLLLLRIVQVCLENFIRFFFPRRLKSLTKDTILVTGSANGLGKELCLALANTGATLVCWDMDKRRNEELIKNLHQKGCKAHSYILDISKYENIKIYAEKVQDEVGNVTMVINNAGIFAMKKLQDHTPEEVEKIFKVNVLSHFWILRHFIPGMIEKKQGHIVAIASAGVYITAGKISSYLSTKHAVHGMMESLRDEMIRTDPPTGINLTTVYPYIMDTNLTKNIKINARFSRMACPVYCAKKIIEGIRRNEEYIDVPWKIVLVTKMVAKLLPPKLLSKFMDILGLTEKNVMVNQPKSH